MGGDIGSGWGGAEAGLSPGKYVGMARSACERLAMVQLAPGSAGRRPGPPQPGEQRRGFLAGGRYKTGGASSIAPSPLPAALRAPPAHPHSPEVPPGLPEASNAPVGRVARLRGLEVKWLGTGRRQAV